MPTGIEANLGAGFPGSWASGLQGSPYAFFDWFLQNWVVPVVIDARNNSVALYGILYKNPRSVGGKFIIENVRDGRNMSGVGAIHADGNLPDPGTQGGYQYSQSVRDVYARVKIQGKIIRAAMKNGGGQLSPVKMEVEGISDDLKIKQEIYLHSDGSGRRAEAAINAPATSTCTVRHNQDNEGVATCLTRPTIYLFPGMRVVFIEPANPPVLRGAAAFYVKQILTDNTCTLSTTLGGAAIADLAATIGYVAGDWICEASREGTFSSPFWLDTGWRGEPMGIEGVFRDSGVLDGNGISVAGQQSGANDFTSTSITAAACGFQGIPVNSGLANYNYEPPAFNRAIVLDAGGAARDISDALLQQMLSDIEERNGGKPKRLWSDFKQYNMYLKTLMGDRRFNSVSNMQGGHTGGITFNGMPWDKSRFALGNKVTMLDEDMFAIYENQELAPITTLGTTQWQQVKDKDAVYMAMMTSYNLFCELRERAGGVLVDLNS